MRAKVHSNGTNSVLAACDSGLVGKTLSDGKIEFRVLESFYGTDEVPVEKLLELLEEHDNINLVGKQCVNAAIGKGLISKRSIIRIEGVPHAQIFKLNA